MQKLKTYLDDIEHWERSFNQSKIFSGICAEISFDENEAKNIFHDLRLAQTYQVRINKVLAMVSDDLNFWDTDALLTIQETLRGENESKT